MTSSTPVLDLLSEAEQAASECRAYEIFEKFIGKWCDVAALSYLSNDSNTLRYVFICAIADYSVELSEPMSDCLILIAKTGDTKIARCACVALTEGGTISNEKYKAALASDELKHLNGFITFYEGIFK